MNSNQNIKLYKSAAILIFSALILTGGIFFKIYNFNLLPSNEFSINNPHFSIAGGVLPHHCLAKEIIRNFFKYLSSNSNPQTIILLSPDHFHSNALCSERSLITTEPKIKKFQDLKVDNFLLKRLANKNRFCFNNSLVSFEHGITNLLPYLKQYFPQSKILPIIIPSHASKPKINQLIKAVDLYGSEQTIILASVDFSHYLPEKAAQFHDIKSIRVLLNFEKKKFQNLDVDCWQCLYGLRLFSKLSQKESPKIIAYKNSAEVSKLNPEQTTSYFSVVFEKKDLKESSILTSVKASLDPEEFNGQTFLFLGDIMLNRGVEDLIQKNSIFYPFQKMSPFLQGIDVIVGNLEGPISRNPPNFGHKSLKFAFLPEVVKGLSFANLNLLSLANNHTLDAGRTGLKETKELLSQKNINWVGHPIKCDNNFWKEHLATSSSRWFSFRNPDVLFLAFNQTFALNCSDRKIAKIVKKINTSNPNQFLGVIFHWGNEYQSKSSIYQKRLAHRLIENGADLIVGSHPHVVQEIEEYKGKLIFYSLGNFIFDQYFSKRTQRGLALGLEIHPQKLIYRLFPIKSHLSQPALMKREEAKKFLKKLAQKSDKNLRKEIGTGTIEIEIKKDTKPTKKIKYSPQTFNLNFDSRPKTANYNLIFPTGQVLKGKTPFKKRIPAGYLKIKISAPHYNPMQKNLYFDQNRQMIFFLDPKGQLVHHLFNIQRVPSPKGTAFSPDGKEIWVTSLLNKKSGVFVFDAWSGKKIARINLDGGGGVEIIFSADGKKAYVSQMETARVFEIDARSKKILRQFKTGGTWTKVLALSPDKKTLFASNWVSDDVSEIDLKKGELIRKIPTVDTPRGIYLTQKGILYVAGFGHGELEKINPDNGQRKIIFKSGGALRHIVADEKKEKLFVSDMAKGVIWQVSLKNDEVKKFAETDINPNTIALSPDKKILFVSCRGKNASPNNYSIPGPEWGSILLFDTENGKMLDAIVAGNQPTALDVSPNGKMFVFSNFLDHHLQVFELPSWRILKKGGGGRSKVYKEDLKKY